MDHRSSRRGIFESVCVGLQCFGRSRLFRYEIRRWHNGVIPDAAHAVASPRSISTSNTQARLLLDLVPNVPTATWGRDELGTGEMWNSNSLIAWLLARSGHGTDTIDPPAGGRAPGWRAGLVAAKQLQARRESSAAQLG
jgi:hypothetical protein